MITNLAYKWRICYISVTLHIINYKMIIEIFCVFFYTKRSVSTS